MKIKAKKTNSASENIIRSSSFVVELRKLSPSSLKAKIQTCKALLWRVFAYSNEQMSKWAWGINSDQSYQWHVVRTYSRRLNIFVVRKQDGGIVSVSLARFSMHGEA